MTYDPYADSRLEHERTHRHVDSPSQQVVVEPVPEYAAPAAWDTTRRIVGLLFGVLQALIVLRVVILLLGANEGNEIVSAILGVTDPFVEPFRGMFSLDAVRAAGGSVLDVAAIVALIAWTLVEALMLGVIGLADRRGRAV